MTDEQRQQLQWTAKMLASDATKAGQTVKLINEFANAFNANEKWKDNGKRQNGRQNERVNKNAFRRVLGVRHLHTLYVKYIQIYQDTVVETKQKIQQQHTLSFEMKRKTIKTKIEFVNAKRFFFFFVSFRRSKMLNEAVKSRVTIPVIISFRFICAFSFCLFFFTFVSFRIKFLFSSRFLLGFLFFWFVFFIFLFHIYCWCVRTKRR